MSHARASQERCAELAAEVNRDFIRGETFWAVGHGEATMAMMEGGGGGVAGGGRVGEGNIGVCCRSRNGIAECRCCAYTVFCWARGAARGVRAYGCHRFVA